MEKILIIEDEKHIAAPIRDALENEGFVVLAARDGAAGLEMALSENIDLIILDIMLPGLDGFSVCKELKKLKKAVPVIMLTARDAVDDKVKGLDMGVEDYMTKPFSVKELVARVKNRLKSSEKLRQKEARKDNILKIGDVKIDFLRMEAEKNGKKVVSTKREYDILRYMADRKGEVVTRVDLLTAVWGQKNAAVTRTVDTFISRIRKKIEKNPSEPKYLISIRDAGYRLSF